MVAIPVKLYPATQSKSISFVTLHSTCHTRLRQKRYCSTHDAEVGQEEVTRGYEYSKDQYVVMEESDFRNLPVASTHTVEITQFVDLKDIDPIYFDRSYVLEPESVGEKPFYLLRKTLESTNRVAVAKVSLRQKEHLCTLRPYGQAILMATMLYPDEIRSLDELTLPEEDSLVSDQELEMAATLVDQLTGAFEPEQHSDEYRATLERAIEARLTSGDPIIAAPAPVRGKVLDLMAALRDSVELVKQESAKKERKTSTARARSNKSTTTQKAPAITA
jgi:DNA end-binding protein Ku